MPREDASAIVDDLQAIVAARWEPLFRDAGLSSADRGRFATCFRAAYPDEA